jgi:hypothetical protein
MPRHQEAASRSRCGLVPGVGRYQDLGAAPCQPEPLGTSGKRKAATLAIQAYYGRFAAAGSLRWNQLIKGMSVLPLSCPNPAPGLMPRR